MRLAGNAAGESAAELIRFFSVSNRDGTLVLTRGRHSLYNLFEAGTVKLQREVTEFGNLTDPVDAFTWLDHDRNQLPWLNGTATSSAISVLRALPDLGTGQPLLSATDLSALLDQLRKDRFDGVITMSDGAEHGVAIIAAGVIHAAAFERDGYVWQRVDALRALQRHSLQEGASPLMLQPLDSATALNLAGMALDARAGTDALTEYSGITSSDSGFVFFLSGKPYLQVRSPVLVAGVRYALARPDKLPDLRLPAGTPGWEDKRFDLTLRGRDALIPMTALAMDFDHRYGAAGRKLLGLLQKGLSAEEVSAQLQVELDTIQSGLEALQKDGMIRVRK